MSTKLPKALLAGAAAVLILSACSSDDTVITEAKAQKEIAFAVTTEAPGRAASYYTTTNGVNNIQKFKVSAWQKPASGAGSLYFTAETLSKTGDDWTYDDDNHIRYWPKNGETLDFYAWVDHSISSATTGEGDDATTTNTYTSKDYTFAWTGDNNNTATLTGIEQKNANEMVDLLYDNVFSEKQTVNASDNDAASSKVTLNMKHAFAQVGVTVKVVDPKIQIEVSEIKLVNLTGKADFKFATSASDNATWIAVANDTKVSPTATIAVPTEYGKVIYNTPQNLTGTNNTFMVIPTTGNTGFQSSAISTTNGETTISTGTGIGLKCKIWNVALGNVTTAGTSYEHTTTDVPIHGTASEYKYLYIPVELNPEMGKNYTYTISFGTGTAGYDENGKDALVKMTWDTSVAEWTNVPGTGENAETLDEIEQ